MTSIRHADPNERDYKAYTNHLFAYNKAIQRRIGSELEGSLQSIGSSYAIVTVGSDARLEKGPVSPIELVVVSKNAQQVPEVRKRLSEYMTACARWASFDTDIEAKTLDGNGGYVSEMVLGQGTPEEIRLTSPNRMFDAWFLAGDRETYHEMQQRLVQEITSDSPGKSIQERIKNKLREHKKVTTTGMQRYKGEDITHFDLQAGIAHYDPDKGLWSFKQGPLRLVQYAIVRDQIRELREGCDPNVIFSASRNTLAKLHDLEVFEPVQINHTTISEITDHYLYFLWMYHRSQKAHQDSQQTVFGFDGSEARKRSEALERICSEPIFRLKHETRK